MRAVTAVLCHGYSSKVTIAAAVKVGCPVQVRRKARREVRYRLVPFLATHGSRRYGQVAAHAV
jgi:hypothetical protein